MCPPAEEGQGLLGKDLGTESPSEPREGASPAAMLLSDIWPPQRELWVCGFRSLACGTLLQHLQNTDRLPCG